MSIPILSVRNHKNVRPQRCQTGFISSRFALF